ncbi:MAG: hypothetical protein U0350_43890 [Caldilineaceae bacterium]
MNVLKPPLTWIKQISQQFAPQNDQERRRDRIVAALIALAATFALLYRFLT